MGSREEAPASRHPTRVTAGQATHPLARGIRTLTPSVGAATGVTTTFAAMAPTLRRPCLVQTRTAMATLTMAGGPTLGTKAVEGAS